jgi:predicted regulator of Ras-like GTPase activity (Roadblock/LC7/MglB family)
LTGERLQADWSVFEEDYWAIRAVMSELLEGSNARSALLVDSTGQIISSLATPPGFDVVSFASLCAADFEANRQLAHLIGEQDFSTLYHQGANESMYLSRVGSREIIAVLFDRRATLGLVRLRVARAVEQLAAVFARVRDKARQQLGEPSPQVDEEFAARAAEEIDRLFRD